MIFPVGNNMSNIHKTNPTNGSHWNNAEVSEIINTGQIYETPKKNPNINQLTVWKQSYNCWVLILY